MNADEYLPNAETVVAIERDVENYDARRRHAQSEIGRRMPALFASYVLACAVVFYFIIANFRDMPEKVAFILLFGGGFAAIAGGVALYRFAHRVGVDTQQGFRDHILPVIFGFVDGLRYSHGYEPGSFRRLPAALKGDYNHSEFGDVITGRLDGRHFEICEMSLSRRSKSSTVVLFKGVALCCSVRDSFPGTLVAVRKPEPSLMQPFNDLMQALSGLLGGERLETVFSRTPLDRAYEFRSDRREEARALFEGGLGDVLGLVNARWQRGSPRLAVRHSEFFLLLPSDKDFFELPPLERPVDYRAHLEPMVRDFATLLAIVAEVQRKPVPDAASDNSPAGQARGAEASPRPVSEEPFIPLLDGNVPPHKR
ncbi:MAG: DUF3137 domain-containing protein [Aquamicrobium sp.]|nr:DUF3137 domain-containing protein [Aquamicrobium sp.]